MPLRLGEKIRKFESKLCSLFGLNVFFNVLTLTCKNYQCSKCNTYLITIFISKWGYCVDVEI